MKRLLCVFLAALMVLGATVSCKKDDKPGKKTPVPEAIDLGLPSGLKWASFNLGASNPWEYGDYYAWGETETKSDYSWSTYKFGTSSSVTSTPNDTLIITTPTTTSATTKFRWCFLSHNQGRFIHRRSIILSEAAGTDRL